MEEDVDGTTMMCNRCQNTVHIIEGKGECDECGAKFQVIYTGDANDEDQ